MCWRMVSTIRLGGIRMVVQPRYQALKHGIPTIDNNSSNELADDEPAEHRDNAGGMGGDGAEQAKRQRNSGLLSGLSRVRLGELAEGAV